MELTDLLKRAVYFIYYLKKLDVDKFTKFINYLSVSTGKSKTTIFKEIIVSSIKYNVSILEYFYFRFHSISEAEKQTFAGTGFMYEYQLLMNPKRYRHFLKDKIVFLNEYASFVNRSFVSLRDLELNKNDAAEIINNTSGRIVLKHSLGSCGIGIQVINAEGLNTASLIDTLKQTGNNIAEEFITQHIELMKLSPSGLNTVRIITQINKNNGVDILGCSLRITNNSVIDNLAAGNFAAPVNEATGKVTGPGVYSDITKNDVYTHPITGTAIENFQVPYWQESVEMVKKAALSNTNNRSIGWDVGITQTGPELIEGNHDWCKLLWQLPVKKGLKLMLENYL